MAAIFPVLMVMIAVVIAAVPWGLPADATFVLPFGTLALVFLLALRRRGAIPPWVSFLAGIATDILTAGPLGFWACVYLLTHVLALLMTRKSGVQSLTDLWFRFVPVVAAASATGWAVASAYFVEVIDWRPIAVGAGGALLLMPVLGAAMRRSLGLARSGFVQTRS